MTNNHIDRTLLAMALVGYEAELEKINAKIAELQGLSNGRVKRTYKKRAVEAVAPIRKRKSFSAATRRKMAAAQKARWKNLKSGKKSEVPF